MKMSKYGLDERPKVVATGKNVLRFFEKWGKLQICEPDRINKYGEVKTGRQVTFDLTVMSGEAAELMEQVWMRYCMSDEISGILSEYWTSEYVNANKVTDSK